MVSSRVLAHGGTVGGLVESAFLVVPLVIFAILAWRKHRNEDKDRPGRDQQGPGP